MEKLSVEELEELREKEFDERAERDERIQNTISLFRKIACVLAVMIAAAFIFFHVRKDYNNYAGSQLVTAEVIKILVLHIGIISPARNMNQTKYSIRKKIKKETKKKSGLRKTTQK